MLSPHWNVISTICGTILLCTAWRALVHTEFEIKFNRTTYEFIGTPDIEPPKLHIRQHGRYWILYNYILATKTHFVGNRSATLTTHTDFLHLGDLELLVGLHWKGPISVAVFASGSDFAETLNSIHYLYDCTDYGPLVRYFVTFSICIHEQHVPGYIPKGGQDIFHFHHSCKRTAPYDKINATTYSDEFRLVYPTNLLRNVARMAARTYYVFPLDLHIYPVYSFIPSFLHSQKYLTLTEPFKSVFCFPLYRADNFFLARKSKTDLKGYLKDRRLRPVLENTSSLARELTFLLNSKSENLFIAKTLSSKVIWDPYFIAVNDKLPMYHETDLEISLHNRTHMFDLLQALKFDFHLMNGAYLIQYPTKKWAFIQSKTKQSTDSQTQLLKLYGALY